MESFATLRNGGQVPLQLASDVFFSLQSLCQQYPVPFVELVALARNPEHKLFGSAGNILQERKLLEPDMTLSDNVRLIVLSATEGEGLDLHTVLPISGIVDKEPIDPQRRRLLDDPQHFALAREIIDFIYAQPSKEEDLRETGRFECLDPFRGQTASGFFLEFYYGIPKDLWTPWGKVSVVGMAVGNWDGVAEMLIERFGATLHIPATAGGVFGPVYALHKLNGSDFPEPIELDREEFTWHEDVTAAWRRLSSASK